MRISDQPWKLNLPEKELKLLNLEQLLEILKFSGLQTELRALQKES